MSTVAISQVKTVLCAEVMAKWESLCLALGSIPQLRGKEEKKEEQFKSYKLFLSLYLGHPGWF